MKKKDNNYVVSITYNFDSSYICIGCETEEEAITTLNSYLEKEVETVKKETLYKPTIVYDSQDDILSGVTLIYEEDAALYDAEGNLTNFDMAFYKVMEIK